MKKLNLKTGIPLAVLLAISTLYACKKNFLNQAPLGVIAPATIANKSGVDGLLIGTYSLLEGGGANNAGAINAAGSNWLFGGVAAGDAYKGSQPSDGGADALPVGNYTYIAANPYITQRYLLLYAGVGRANTVLATIPLAKDMTAADVKEESAEARFLRGFYYLELRKQYGMVPYYDETTTAQNVANNVEIWPKIEADFQFAIDNMNATQAQKGRANKWAAVGFMAKTLMFEQKYAAALPLLQSMIASGVTSQGAKYSLDPIFQTNFSPQPGNKNSPESVFAAQTSVNDGSGGANADKGDELGLPYSANSPGSCCGWNNPSQWLANSYKTDAAGLPLLTTFNTAGGDISNTTRGAKYTGNVDPRLDITVGRPGVPYLDWGSPDASWIRDATNGVFSPRKNAYAKAEKGTLSDNTPGVWDAVQAVATNVNLMRYADVLLMAAEAETEAGSLASALVDVNLVRARAANPAGWVYLGSAYSVGTGTYAVNATPADKYVVGPYAAFADQATARTAIHFERKIELGMEGMRWYDLQRWDGASKSDPIAGSNGSMAAEINAFFASDITINSQLQGAHFTAGKNEYYAIPQSEIDNSKGTGTALLQQNKGY